MPEFKKKCEQTISFCQEIIARTDASRAGRPNVPNLSSIAPAVTWLISVMYDVEWSVLVYVRTHEESENDDLVETNKIVWNRSG
jgi:hypothetical protein